MTSSESDLPIQYHGKILRADGEPVGTCFQIAQGVLVTAYHVVQEASNDELSQLILFEPLESHVGDKRATARVERVDEERDLAVLRTEFPLPRNASHLSLSSSQEMGSQFLLMGFASLSESSGHAVYNYLPATGTWQGTAERVSGAKLVRGEASGVEPGMSGCPILRTGDNAIIGVLHGRYNSGDEWSRGTVWITPIEALLPLLDGIATVPVDDSSGSPTSTNAWLTETPLDKNRLLNDNCFLLPSEWEQSWNQGQKALQEGQILVTAAPPGIGSTTFAEQLLARTVSSRTQITRLDPGEWTRPNVKLIPRRPWCAYILDLQDPDHDDPSADFIEGLSSLAAWLKSMQSRLVITVRESLWRGWEARRFPLIRTVQLEMSPRPSELIQQYVKVQAPILLPIAQDATIVKHFDGMNAVQAVEAAEKIIKLSREFSASKNNYLESATKLARDILDSHLDELDALFADPELPISAQAKAPETIPLRLQDRCMLIALACRRSVRLSQLENDSRDLESLLYGGNNGNTVIPILEPHTVLAGPGLRGRVNRIQAHLRQNETVTFQRASFADAAVNYVWDNYSKIRVPLTKWLIQLAREGGPAQRMTSERLSMLVRRHQDVDFIKNELSKIGDSQDKTEILAEVLYNSVVDPHMQRRCERILYDWAQRPDLQAVVVRVCTRLLLSNPPNRPLIALRRLQRVADAEKTSTEMRKTVAETFSKATRDKAVWPTFIERARVWFRDAPRLTSTKLAFMAILPISVDGVPWILSGEAQSDHVDQMLSEALSEPLTYEAVTTLVHQLHGNRMLYEQFMDLLARAAAGGSTGAAFRFARHLQTVGEITGYNPIADLYTRLQLVPLPTSPHREASLN